MPLFKLSHVVQYPHAMHTYNSVKLVKFWRSVAKIVVIILDLRFLHVNINQYCSHIRSSDNIWTELFIWKAHISI